MNFHPNDVQRRGRSASAAVFFASVVLTGAFFRAQVLQHAQYTLQAEENRLRDVPLPGARGFIYDRNGAVIAENVPGHTVLLLSPNADSLRAALKRLSRVITIGDNTVEAAMSRFRRSSNRPTVILPDASFEVVSVLEEHRVEFPGLIIQESPKRYYPDGKAVAAIVGYTGPISEDELNQATFKGYKPGQQVGKSGIEREYELQLRGTEGVRFVEVDARGRVVREAGARADLQPKSAPPLLTNIDLDLQKFVAGIFGDSLQGAAIAIEPKTGEVLALHSAPIFDPNKFIGGISPEYYKQLLTDPRNPLLNKATQGTYAPGSTWKLATAVIGLQNHLVKLDEHMQVPCNGVFQYGNRPFKCHSRHGSLNLMEAIEQSCDVYFYQLGLRIGLSKLVAGGISLGGGNRSGIDLPNETRPRFSDSALKYFERLYGPRGYSQGNSLNIAIGQGENAQTVVNMARLYTALATDGNAARPRIAKGENTRDRVFDLDSATMAGLRAALMGVVSRGTATGARIQGAVLAGKTGTAQTNKFVNGVELNHAWFVGFAPANDPKIVVAVMLEFGGHGPRSAAIASKIIQHYLKQATQVLIQTEGE